MKSQSGRVAILTAILLLAAGGVSVAQTSSASVDEQIAHTVLALPEDMRAAATVVGYGGDGMLETLREGTSDMICVADEPGDDRYSAVCYHKSLDPFISRGRELRAEGVEGKDVLARRHEEMEAGTLETA